MSPQSTALAAEADALRKALREALHELDRTRTAVDRVRALCDFEAKRYGSVLVHSVRELLKDVP